MLMLSVLFPNICLCTPLLDDMMNVVNDIVPAFGSFANLLQVGTTTGTGGGVAVVNPGAVVTPGVVGGPTGVTTLPAPVVTTTTTPMMTMAPGIAVGILGALLLGSLY